MPTQDATNGRVRCDCGAQMRYRRRTKEYVCTLCPAVVPLSSLTPLQPVTKSGTEVVTTSVTQ